MGTFVIGVTTVICMTTPGGPRITGLIKAEGPKYVMVETVRDIELQMIEKDKCVSKP